MKIAAVIAEFNPFHNGHAYLINKIKTDGRADYVVTVMSGDFVQRGTPAIFDKYVRTRMALAGGADAVLELPVACAAGSAQRFAEGGVHILDALDCMDELWFGSEAGSIEPFEALSAILADEPDTYQAQLHKALAAGLSFPAAREQALPAVLSFPDPKACHFFLREPNNILGLEYCLALRKSGSSITPRTISRAGSGYNETTLDPEGRMSSASAIRKILLDGGKIDGLAGQVPASVFPLLSDAVRANSVVTADDFSPMLRYQLLRETPGSLAQYLDIGPDLARRIYNCRDSFRSFSQFADLVKTKNYTLSAIRRALLHILLGIRVDDLAAAERPAGIRLLGFRKEAEPLIREMASRSTVPLLTRAAEAAALLTPADRFASDLYASVQADKTEQEFQADLSRKMIVV